MVKFFRLSLCSLFVISTFLMFGNAAFGQKAKEVFVFEKPDFLKKQKGIRLSDSAEFILFNNEALGYTELYQKRRSIWFVEKAPDMLVIDYASKDTLGRENYNVLTLDQNAKYQWVIGEGEDYGYFFRKGQIVLTVQTINRRKKCYLKIAYNERDKNIEFIKQIAIYKAHKHLNLNHDQEVTEQVESLFE